MDLEGFISLWAATSLSGMNLPHSGPLWTLDASPRAGPCHSAISTFIPRAFASACAQFLGRPEVRHGPLLFISMPLFHPPLGGL